MCDIKKFSTPMWVVIKIVYYTEAEIFFKILTNINYETEFIGLYSPNKPRGYLACFIQREIITFLKYIAKLWVDSH